MSYPPPGYDDESVVPQHRLRSQLGRFEDRLDTVQAVFHEHVMENAYPEHSFDDLRLSAEELGTDYPFLVERLIADYEAFRAEPTEERLEKLFSDVRNLQLLLVG